jgi:hypothetical protein
LSEKINQVVGDRQILFSQKSFEQLQLETQLKILKELLAIIENSEIVGEEIPDELQNAIDELCRQIDTNFACSSNIYKECAMGKNYEIHKKGDVHLDAIYSKSTEGMEKLKLDSNFDPNVKEQLVEFLNKVIPHIEKDLENENKKNIPNEKTIGSILSNDPESSKKIYDHLKNQISVHKRLSYRRFVELFEIHSRLVNRFHFAISLLQDEKDKEIVREIFIEAVSLENTLQDTALHRNCQGRHSVNEKTETKRHKNLDTINPLIQLITLDNKENFDKYECAHVVPAPGLFYRRGGKHSAIANHHVSFAYSQLKNDEKEEKTQLDLISIYKKHKKNAPEYASHVLDLVLRLASEESSCTIHLPSFFNQEIDGVSEKYIKLEALDSTLQDKFNSLKATNYKIEEEKKKATAEEKEKAKAEGKKSITYTTKPYKYMLASAVHAMVSNRSYKPCFTAVVLNEEDYLNATKLSIAHKINQLVMKKEPSIADIIAAYALMNVFMGVKNAEAKAGISLTTNDDEVYKAIRGLEKNWKLT